LPRVGKLREVRRLDIKLEHAVAPVDFDRRPLRLQNIRANKVPRAHDDNS